MIELKANLEMLAIALLLLVNIFGQLNAAEISCESVGYFSDALADLPCCYLDSRTTIEAANVTFASAENSEVGIIYFNYNKKVQFLPVKVYKKFPDLEYYLASDANIEEITALNFEKLTSLESLDLGGNRIEFVPNFCFQDLVRLTEIILGEN